MIVRAGWLVLGLACVAIGAVGVVVPGLPTTVFFIIAAGAFARSSPRLEAWVLGLPAIGPAVRDYRAGLGMPRRAKVTSLAMLTIACTISVFLVEPWWLRLTIIVVALVGVVVILRVPTRSV